MPYLYHFAHFRMHSYLLPKAQDIDSIDSRFRSRGESYLSPIIVNCSTLFSFLDYSESVSNQRGDKQPSISSRLYEYSGNHRNNKLRQQVDIQASSKLSEEIQTPNKKEGKEERRHWRESTIGPCMDKTQAKKKKKN